MKIKALKGFKDIVPDEIELWNFIDKTARSVFERFNFSEIRMPILEATELFARSIGETTDIVEKEMYTFPDKKITMRPEATASMLRAYIENGLYAKKPVQRLFTIGPMFRHERPQKGRLRQFHQLDVEVLGSENSLVDAELMAMGALFFNELGIDVSLELNSLGCPECRPGYRKILIDYITTRLDNLCSDCKRRAHTNPLRVLDCKVPGCREQIKSAPSVQDHLCQGCRTHFDNVQKGLEMLNIEYSLNKFMVRGLDYYCKTTFEFITGDLGAQSAVAAGGRYDGLIEELGGPKNSPGIGFAMGVERIVLLLQQQKSVLESAEIDLYIAGIGEPGALSGYRLAHQLRKEGWSVAMDHEGKSLKSQMKQADKANARYTLIIGESELEKGKGLLRDMKNRDAEQVDVELSATAIVNRLQQ